VNSLEISYSSVNNLNLNQENCKGEKEKKDLLWKDNVKSKQQIKALEKK